MSTSAPEPPRKLITTTQAASYLSCKPATIRRMIRLGQLSGFRVGRALRVDQHELDQMMQPIPPESVYLPAAHLPKGERTAAS